MIGFGLASGTRLRGGGALAVGLADRAARVGSLPDVGALVLGEEHLVAPLHLEGVIPSVDLGQGGVDAGHVGGVDVAGDDELYVFRGHV